jgi:membrane protein
VETAAEVNLPDTESPAEPAKLTDVDRRSWKFIAKKVFREFNDDQSVGLSAGLTFYAVLALFPALLAMVALLGLIGSDSIVVRVARSAPG